MIRELALFTKNSFSIRTLINSKFHPRVHKSPTHWSSPSTRWAQSTSSTLRIFKFHFNIILPLCTLKQWSNLRHANAYDDCFLVLTHLQSVGLLLSDVRNVLCK